MVFSPSAAEKIVLTPFPAVMVVRPAGHGVAAVAQVELVGAGAGVDEVVAVTDLEVVVAVAAEDLVRAVAGGDAVVAAAVVDGVGTEADRDGVAAVAAVDHVVAVAGGDGVAGPGADRDEVVAVADGDGLAARPAVGAVVGRPGEHGVVPGAVGDVVVVVADQLVAERGAEEALEVLDPFGAAGRPL